MIRIIAALTFLVTGGAQAGELNLFAPGSSPKPINQLKVSGNACGPAALLSALESGSKQWRGLARGIPAGDDRIRVSHLIRNHGLRPSAHLPSRNRWDRKNGVNLLDLTDIGNELRAGHWQIPTLKSEVLVAKGRESGPALLRRAHGKLSRSLKRGLPPIVSLRRIARPSAQVGPTAQWRVVYGHFVVITAIPSKLHREATSFPFRYIDPWGGRVLAGTLHIDTRTGFPTLLVGVPSSTIGKSKVKAGETSVVSLTAAIGAF